MLVQLAEKQKNSAMAREASDLIKACVHCGFCLATCPTYQLLGDERDSPRGRIYLVKQLLEGEEVTERTQLHLDRCLSCRSCETTCPSGVRYGRLVDLGRELVAGATTRPWSDVLVRRLIRLVLPYPARFGVLVQLAKWFRPVLPRIWRSYLPSANDTSARKGSRHACRMLLLEGCVQPVLTPSINTSASRLLDRLGISVEVMATPGCCGAISHHLSAREEALDIARRNIDTWLPFLERGYAGIVSTASGCGMMIKEYGELLRQDPVYREPAARISAATRDLAEVVVERLGVSKKPSGRKLVFQSPCSLRHGQKINGLVERILVNHGYELAVAADGHLCCGSAGTYSILQPAISSKLRADKLAALEGVGADGIASANIGCILHLRAAARIPIRHWVEWIEDPIN